MSCSKTDPQRLPEAGTGPVSNFVFDCYTTIIHRQQNLRLVVIWEQNLFKCVHGLDFGWLMDGLVLDYLSQADMKLILVLQVNNDNNSNNNITYY
jgi:hypothetical protein